MPQYVAMAYRENGSDYCRGCEMERWGSDFQFKASTDLDEIAKFYLEAERTDRAREHGSYEITLLVDGEEDYDLQRTMASQARTIVDEEVRVKAAKEKAAAEIRENKRKQAEAARKEAEDKAEFARLKAKFEPAVTDLQSGSVE